MEYIASLSFLASQVKFVNKIDDSFVHFKNCHLEITSSGISTVAHWINKFVNAVDSLNIDDIGKTLITAAVSEYIYYSSFKNPADFCKQMEKLIKIRVVLPMSSRQKINQLSKEIDQQLEEQLMKSEKNLRLHESDFTAGGSVLISLSEYVVCENKDDAARNSHLAFLRQTTDLFKFLINHVLQFEKTRDGNVEFCSRRVASLLLYNHCDHTYGCSIDQDRSRHRDLAKSLCIMSTLTISIYKNFDKIPSIVRPIDLIGQVMAYLSKYYPIDNQMKKLGAKMSYAIRETSPVSSTTSLLTARVALFIKLPNNTSMDALSDAGVHVHSIIDQYSAESFSEPFVVSLVTSKDFSLFL